MNILSRLKTEKTGQLRPLTKPLITTEYTLERTPNERNGYGLATQAEHILRLEVVTRFWANQAQVSAAKRTAERALLHEIYSDTLGRVDRAIHEIANGDSHEAIRLLVELRDQLSDASLLGRG